MSEWFEVGQKVVCVFDIPAKSQAWPVEAKLFIRRGQTYVVAGIHAPMSADAKAPCFLSFEGGPIWPVNRTAMQFDCRGFRPLRKRKTDISTFKAILNNTKGSVDA